MKRCSRCKRSKALEEFNRSARGPQGRQAYCRDCVREKHREYASTTEGRAKQRERSRRRNAVRSADPEYREYARRKSAEWRARNRERHNANAKAWRKKNPEGYRVQSARRRAKLYGVANSLTMGEWLSVLDRLGRRCFYCGGPFESMDHVEPMSQGGPNSVENVVPACLSCNCSKHDRPQPRALRPNRTPH